MTRGTRCCVNTPSCKGGGQLSLGLQGNIQNSSVNVSHHRYLHQLHQGGVAPVRQSRVYWVNNSCIQLYESLWSADKTSKPYHYNLIVDVEGHRADNQGVASSNCWKFDRVRLSWWGWATFHLFVKATHDRDMEGCDIRIGGQKRMGVCLTYKIWAISEPKWGVSRACNESSRKCKQQGQAHECRKNPKLRVSIRRIRSRRPLGCKEKIKINQPTTKTRFCVTECLHGQGLCAKVPSILKFRNRQKMGFRERLFRQVLMSKRNHTEKNNQDSTKMNGQPWGKSYLITSNNLKTKEGEETKGAATQNMGRSALPTVSDSVENTKPPSENINNHL